MPRIMVTTEPDIAEAIERLRSQPGDQSWISPLCDQIETFYRRWSVDWEPEQQHDFIAALPDIGPNFKGLVYISRHKLSKYNSKKASATPDFPNPILLAFIFGKQIVRDHALFKPWKARWGELAPVLPDRVEELARKVKEHNRQLSKRKSERRRSIRQGAPRMKRGRRRAVSILERRSSPSEVLAGTGQSSRDVNVEDRSYLGSATFTGSSDAHVESRMPVPEARMRVDSPQMTHNINASNDAVGEVRESHQSSETTRRADGPMPSPPSESNPLFGFDGLYTPSVFQRDDSREPNDTDMSNIGNHDEPQGSRASQVRELQRMEIASRLAQTTRDAGNLGEDFYIPSPRTSRAQSPIPVRSTQCSSDDSSATQGAHNETGDQDTDDGHPYASLIRWAAKASQAQQQRIEAKREALKRVALEDRNIKEARERRELEDRNIKEAEERRRVACSEIEEAEKRIEVRQKWGGEAERFLRRMTMTEEPEDLAERFSG